MNQPIRRVALFCFLLIVSLLVSSNYLQVVNADSYKARAANQRTKLDEYAFPRGVLKTADGVVIADSVPSNGIRYKYQRQYPQGALYGNLTGYKSVALGQTGLESKLDKYLQGSDSSESVSNFLDTISGTSKKGGDVQLTIDSKVQKAAADALGKRPGSVVALDPTTGAILAMYSSPSYDPNTLAANDGSSTAGKSASAVADAMAQNPAKPNLNHAIGETYAPGSIFKIITAAAALDSGQFTEKDPTPASPTLQTFPGSRYTLSNENSASCPGTDLKTALQNSCNTVFGYVGVQLGAGLMASTAAKFGLNSPTTLTTPLNVVQSVFPSTEIASNTTYLAQSSIGQFDTRITPLQAAMIAAAVANNGTLMKPYLVQKEVSPRGSTTSTAKPEVLSQAMTPQTAQTLDDMMVNVVQNGTGKNAQIPNVHVGGKTGTAQRGGNLTPLPWFISYASLNGKSVAVAVLVQDDSSVARDDITGGGIAGPVAKTVMETALGVPQQ